MYMYLKYVTVDAKAQFLSERKEEIIYSVAMLSDNGPETQISITLNFIFQSGFMKLL